MRDKLVKIVQVPDTWEAWVQRVLTIAVLMVLIASAVLIDSLHGLHEYLVISREQRGVFQVEETARQCQILFSLGVTKARLAELKC